MDGTDNRNDRNERNDRNDRNDRNSGGGYRRDFRGNRFHRRDGGNFQNQQNRGRSQRPLLTSAINGAGLTLVALVLVFDKGNEAARFWLSGAVVSFGVSAIVSYVAQRVRGVWVEKVSDLFFLAGAVIVIVEAAQLGGLLR